MFNRYLKRLHRGGQTQRGIIVFDKATYETDIQSLATDFRKFGWGVIHNLCEVPLFLDSKASRLVQAADLIWYALFPRRHGMPLLYEQFLTNVVRREVQEYAVPLPQTSETAAAILKRLGIRPDLVHLDAARV